MWISTHRKGLWTTWSWKTSCNFTILGCPSQSFSAVISFWVLASILRDETVSLCRPVRQVDASVAPNLTVFLFTANSECKWQSLRMKLPWNNESYYPPEQAVHYSQKRLFLSQKRANHREKWTPFLPDNSGIGIQNYGGNNRLPKEPAGYR